MAWVAVDRNGNENMFHNSPDKKLGGYWQDDVVYWEVRGYTTCAHDYSIPLPKGTIEKLIGRQLTWEDDAVEL